MAVRVLIEAAKVLSQKVGDLSFSEPVTHVYNPLDHAWRSHRQYLSKYGKGSKRVVFLGMNPGPWGMSQTGVPFGEVGLVKDWMGIEARVDKPDLEHPKRPIDGFECQRSEVSGQRLWGYFSQRFPQAEDFFEDHFVLNHCPLVFMEESGRNRTPDKIPASEAEPLFDACDEHLKTCISTLKPEHLVGVGAYATKRLKALFDQQGYGIHSLLHPSPASPVANRGWATQAHRQLEAMGLA